MLLQYIIFAGRITQIISIFARFFRKEILTSLSLLRMTRVRRFSGWQGAELLRMTSLYDKKRIHT